MTEGNTAIVLSVTALVVSCVCLLAVIGFISFVIFLATSLFIVPQENEVWLDELLDVNAEVVAEMDYRLQPLADDLRVELAVLKELNSYEKLFLPSIIPRGKLGITWEDVGGCEEALDRIWQQLVLPLVYTRYFGKDPRIMPAKGILLYGAPGCGKTLIAKAITAEVDCNFLAVDMSKIRDKWMGESEKMAEAIFSLANKIQPCIIFIDEVDALLGQRNASDTNTDLIIKSVFLSRWDGLETDDQSMVFILAATNRKNALDPGILRRFSLQFNIPKPDEAGRRQILNILLRGRPLDADVDVAELARVTEGFTGSDLKEVVRCASASVLQDLLKACGLQHLGQELRYSEVARRHGATEPRPVTMDDLLRAVTDTPRDHKTRFPFYV